MDITKEEKEVLFHTLGFNHTPRVDRNFFGTSKGCSDCIACESLVVKELMVSNTAPSWSGDDFVFAATNAGRNMAYKIDKEYRASLHNLTRSQWRYRAYLKSESDETFIDWLKNGYWNDCRKRMVV